MSALLAQGDGGAALGKAGCAARALEGQGVGVGRVHVGDGHLAGEFGLDRANRCGHRDLVFVVTAQDDGIAASDALFEDFRIVEAAPDFGLREGDELFAGHFHGCLLLEFRVCFDAAGGHFPLFDWDVPDPDHV